MNSDRSQDLNTPFSYDEVIMPFSSGTEESGLRDEGKQPSEEITASGYVKPKLPKTRLIEPRKTGSADPAPLDPDFDLANIITEPDKIYALYRGQYKCSGFICSLSILGSLIFEAILPFQIGQYVLNVVQKDAGTIN